MTRIFKDEETARDVGMWCRATIYDDAAAQAYCARHKMPITRAASEGIGIAGGFLVPAPMQNSIIVLREERGIFRRNARVLGMTSDSASQPRRTGGLTAVFAAEATAATESSAAWDSVGFVGKKLLALTRASSELDEDAIGLAEQITSEIAYAFASKEDDCGFNGDGTSTYGGIRGITHLDGDVLATYPRDEVRGVVLRRTVKLGEKPSLSFQAGVDADRAWELNVYANNKMLLKKTIEASAGTRGKHWQEIKVDLGTFAGQEVQLRLYQRVLIAGRTAGNAYWKAVKVE